MAEQAGVSAGSSLDTGIVRMFELPLELQQIVVNSLVPDHLPIGTNPRVSADALTCRKTLFNLCLTSKACRDLALRPLYKYVIITDYVQLAGLLVTLITHVERRGWIHRVAVLVEIYIADYAIQARRNVDFMAKTILRLQNCDPHISKLGALVMSNALRTDIRTHFAAFKNMIARAPVVYRNILNQGADSGAWNIFRPDEDAWTDYESELSEFHRPLLQFLLTAQTNMKDILISITPSHGQVFCFPTAKNSIMSQFRLDPTQFAPENPFKNLVSVRKQADRHDFGHLTPDPLAPEYLASRDWEFFQDSGKWFFNSHMDGQGWHLPGAPPGDLVVFSHITDLALRETLTHPAQLRIILKSCKSLKALCYIPYPPGWTTYTPIPSTDEEEGTPVPTLQQALDEVKETLVELRLAWGPQSRIYWDQVVEALAPHKVNTRGFPRLTSVDIDPAFVR